MMDKGRGLVFFWGSCYKLVSFFFQFHHFSLKVVPAMFLLVCFVCLKESTCETRRMFFYFTLKASFVLEIIKGIQMS